ncbi:MAG: xylulokinase [Promethearchaeota archaeon]|jgi:xylulokinase
MDYFLGLDCSTQSLTSNIIDYNSKEIVHRESINFDEDLAHYNTINGVIVIEDEKIVHSYPCMWIEALDLIFSRIKNAKIPFSEIKAISGSAQQHGTIYVNNRFKKKLKNLNSNIALVTQLKETFSRETSPIWMDSSTTRQCKEIRDSLGGMIKTIKITGSNTFERFSGPQIRKFFQESREKYNETDKIHLVSSFMASILIGTNAPIDHGDGAGMNLMNIQTKEWDKRALKATALDLEGKLPNLCNSFDIIGTISDYFVEKYGFNSKCVNIAWSGDNPNSLIGVGLIEKGKVAISLGTSDTYFGYLHDLYLDLKGEGHVFAAPTGDYMSLICYKNGSLARERVRDQFNLNWSEFSRVLNKTPPGNYGRIMLPYFFPEIVPLVLEPKVFRFGLAEDDLEGNIRAIIEAQFLSMRLHSEWIGEKPQEIYATGGASANENILQIAANVFSIQIKKFEFANSAALGAALRSAKSYYDLVGERKSWQEITKSFSPLSRSRIITPNKELKPLYDEMLQLYKKCEEHILKKGIDPEPFRLNFIKKYFP